MAEQELKQLQGPEQEQDISLKPIIAIIMMVMMMLIMTSILKPLEDGDGELPEDGDGNGDGDGDVVEPPEVEITNAVWQSVEHEYTNVWDDVLVATFYRGLVSVTASEQFTGKIVLSCPYTISPVPLLAEQGLEELLAEIDDLIANSTGTTQELWIDRKALVLQFPSVDGFWIDYRWYGDWDRYFREWINESVDQLIWQGIDINVGTNTIYIGFFKVQNVGVTAPVFLGLYNANDELVGTYEVELPEAADSPAPQNLALPSEVQSGAEFNAEMLIRVPEVIQNHHYSYIEVQIDLSPIGRQGTQDFAKTLVSTEIANSLIESMGSTSYIPMDSPDDMYTLVYECVARYDRERYTYPLPAGQYPVHVRIETWRVDAAQQGLNFYGLEPYSVYRYYGVGTLNVV